MSGLTTIHVRARWLDRALALRDWLVANPRFRRGAAAFPLTRPIARRRARALFDLCAGFVYSQVLLAVVRLRLPEILAEGPQTAAALSPRLGLSPSATARLLAAAEALGLVARRGRDRVGLGPLGAALVGDPGIAAMVEHHAMLYADLRDPVALLRGERAATELGRYWPYADKDALAGLGEAHVAPYTGLMSASQALIAGEVLDAYRLDRHRCLLDVGGGDGTFLAAAARRTSAATPSPTMGVISAAVNGASSGGASTRLRLAARSGAESTSVPSRSRRRVREAMFQPITRSVYLFVRIALTCARTSRYPTAR